MSKNNFSKAMKELIGISDTANDSSNESATSITDFSDLDLIEEAAKPVEETTNVSDSSVSSANSAFDKERDEAAAKLRMMLNKDREKDKEKTVAEAAYKPMEVATENLGQSTLKPVEEKSNERSFASSAHTSTSSPVNNKEIPSIKSNLDKSISPEEAKTVIGKGVVITGSISAQGDMEVRGTIKGDLKTTGSLVLSGKIAGDVGVENLNVLEGAIQGDVMARGTANIGKDTVILGDVTAGNLNLNGKVKGNIAAREMADLSGTSIIDGNVSAASVAIDPGTKLRGQISLTSASDVNDDDFAVDFD